MFYVYVSDRLERLADRLAEYLQARPLTDLWQPEIVVVPNRGIERWLAMRLAERLGAWGLARYPFPQTALVELYSRLIPLPPGSPVWDRTRLQWTLFGLLEHPDLWPPFYRQQFVEDPDALHRWYLARSLAVQFEQYEVYRPEWIEAWQHGRTPSELASVRELAEWTARLWVAARERIAAAGPGELVMSLIRAVQQVSAKPKGWPERLVLFGLSALPPLYVHAFHAVARWVDVHLFAFNPCKEMWFDISSPRARRPAPTCPAPSLLSMNGRLGRDYLGLLCDVTEGQWEEVGPTQDTPPATALQVLQQRIRDFVPDEPTDHPHQSGHSEWPEGDRSVQVHCCHSPRRELEVLRDYILDCLDRLPGLTPRDILVAAPDIHRYAPMIEAVFSGEEPRIPFSIADRSPLRVGHLAEVLRRILRLVDTDSTAPDVYDLLCLPPVARRFGFSPEALSRVRDWIGQAHIRRGWSADASTPEPGSWDFGMDRLILGAVLRTPPTCTVAGLLPCPVGELESLRLLCAFVDSLRECVESLRAPASIPQWAGRLIAVLDRLCAPGPDEHREWSELRARIQQWGQCTQGLGLDKPVPRALVRAALEDLLDPTALAAPMLSGGVTCCNLVPMRCIPFRVICILGMDSESFPRSDPRPDFDLFRHAPACRGDRDRRTDDRYLFLETLMAARDGLFISYTGRDPRTDREIPPSVCVSELLDTLDRVDPHARAHVWVQHPLHPFSPRYYGGDPRLFSYSVAYYRSLETSHEGSTPFEDVQVTWPLPPQDADTQGSDPESRWWVTPAELARFFRDPVREALRLRLGVRAPRFEWDLPDQPVVWSQDIPAQDYLRQWVATAIRTGQRPTPLSTILRAAGLFLPATSAELYLRRWEGQANFIWEQLEPWLREKPVPAVETQFTAHHVTLWVRWTDLRPCGLVRWCQSGEGWSDLIEPWLEHLLLSLAAPPGAQPTTHWLIGDRMHTLQPAPEAARNLANWLEAYRTGLTQLLPLWPPFARKQLTARDPNKVEDRLRDIWLGSEFSKGWRRRYALHSSLYPSEDPPWTQELAEWTQRLYQPLREALFRE
jgi:exodeoxyribonuclease V gamma subunit